MTFIYDNRCFYVYILTNVHKSVLYTGVTNDLEQRIAEHYFQRGQPKYFAGKYNVHYLLYYEPYQYIKEAIWREKQIKGWTRAKKFELIGTMNPSLEFLNDKFFKVWPPVKLGDRSSR
jgi:putative endonuclease